MTKAEHEAKNPSKATTQLMSDVQRASTASQSLTRTDILCDDGSHLAVVSRNGGPAELHLTPPGEQIPEST